MKRRRVWFGAGALVAAGVLGSLGAAPAVASKASDTQIAEAGLLVQSDFPAGWTSTPRDTSSDASIEKTAKKIPVCAEYLALRVANDRQANVQSPAFELGQSQIDNTVTVFPTVAGAAAAMKTFSRPSIVKCISALFTKVAAPATVKVSRADIEPIADGTTAYEGTVTVTEGGEKTTLGVGVAAVRTDRGVAVYSYTVSSTTVLQLLPSLVDASVARLTAALA